MEIKKGRRYVPVQVLMVPGTRISRATMSSNCFAGYLVLASWLIGDVAWMWYLHETFSKAPCSWFHIVCSNIIIPNSHYANNFP